MNTVFTEPQNPTDKTIPTVPDAKVDRTTETAITISWNKPDDTENVSAYRVICTVQENQEGNTEKENGDQPTEASGSKESADEALEMDIDELDVTTATFSGLHPGSSYVLDIFSVHEKKQSKAVSLEASTSKFL